MDSLAIISLESGSPPSYGRLTYGRLLVTKGVVDRDAVLWLRRSPLSYPMASTVLFLSLSAFWTP